MGPNTPKVSRNGISVLQVEGANQYGSARFLLTTAAGTQRDITDTIQSFYLEESLFSPEILLKATIYDEWAVFEDLRLNGQETIRVEVARENSFFGKSSTVSINFNVLQYENLSRDKLSQQNQTMELIAISDFAYLSSLKKISRAISGASIDAATKILEKDLYVTKSKISADGNSSTRFNAVIPISEPLQALSWILRKTFDSKSTPFTSFSRISDGKVHLDSYGNLFSKSPHKTLKYRSPDTNGGFSEQYERILDLEVPHMLSRLSQSREGAFASETTFVDTSSKTIRTISSQSDSSLKQILNPHGREFSSYAVNGSSSNSKDLYSISDSSRSFRASNSSSFGINSRGTDSKEFSESLHSMNAYESALLNTLPLVLRVNGDQELNPGKLVDVIVPRSISTEKITSQNQQVSKDAIDSNLSGRFVITMARHLFEKGYYYTYLNVSRIK